MDGPSCAADSAMFLHDFGNSARPLQSRAGTGFEGKTAPIGVDHHDHHHHHNNYGERTSASTATIPLEQGRDIALRCPSVPFRVTDGVMRIYGRRSSQPNGRLALILATSVTSTSIALLDWRLRFAFFAESK